MGRIWIATLVESGDHSPSPFAAKTNCINLLDAMVDVYSFLENGLLLRNFATKDSALNHSRVMVYKFLQQSVRMVFLGMLLGLVGGCMQANEPASSTMEEGFSDADTSFADFLDLFPTDPNFKDWPETGQRPVVDSVFYLDDMEPCLRKTFRRIPHGQLKRIPTTKILNLDGYSTKIKKPYKAFRFYAFHKVKKKNYWLVGVYAHKQQRNANNEFFGHPFLMLTYDRNGRLIDSFVWWHIDHDMLEVYTEIAVEGETLLVGRKEELHDSYLTEIYQKTIVTKGGRFQTVYSEFPRCDF